jgi:hypothetical protein
MCICWTSSFYRLFANSLRWRLAPGTYEDEAVQVLFPGLKGAEKTLTMKSKAQLNKALS